MVAMAVLMSTACSQGSEDTTEQGGGVPVTDTRTAISFSGQQAEEQAVNQGTNRAQGMTRAGTPLSDSKKTFKVWGYKNMSESNGDYGTLQTVFPGYVVNWISGSAASTSSNSSGWEYVAQQTGSDPEQTIKYWDWEAKAYRYFAVTGTYTANDANTEFTMEADCSGATDEAIATNIAAAPFFSHLWFSTGQLPTYADKQFGKPVVLEFLKPFARVRFLFNYSYAAEGVKVTAPHFKPTDGTKKIARKGTVKVTYPLTGTQTSESYAVTPAEGGELAEFNEEYIPEGTEKWYTVLPVPTQGSYTMTVTVNNAQTPKTAVVPAQYMSWKPGYSYTYIFKITEDGGVEIDLVQAAVTAWTELVNDYTVYNW
jgi:hypothetical protein